MAEKYEVERLPGLDTSPERTWPGTRTISVSAIRDVSGPNIGDLLQAKKLVNLGQDERPKC